jgi:hypothetical protein
VPRREVPREQVPHCELAVQVVARSGQSLTAQLEALVQLPPPNTQVPLLRRGQSLSWLQTWDVDCPVDPRQWPYGEQLPPRLQLALPYWHRGRELQRSLVLHESRL